MRTGQALRRAARCVLLLLAMGATAGGGWPEVDVPAGADLWGPAGPGARTAARPVMAQLGGTLPQWAGFGQRAERWDEFAAYLVADARSQWQDAAGDLARAAGATLPRLVAAWDAAREAVARAGVTGSWWQEVGQSLASLWTAGRVTGGASRDRDTGAPLPAPVSGSTPDATAATDRGTNPATDKPAHRSAPGAGQPAAPGGEGQPDVAPRPAAAPLPDPVTLIPGPERRSPGAAAVAGEQPDAPQASAPAGHDHAREPGADGDRPAGPSPARPEGGGEEAGRGAASGGDAAGAGAAAGEWHEAVASWYGPGFYGRPTASGEVFTGRELTAAHRTMPFGTVLLVRYPVTGRSVRVRINDRGPFVEGRDLDLSEAAAETLGMISAGVARVYYQILRWGG